MTKSQAKIKLIVSYIDVKFGIGYHYGCVKCIVRELVTVKLGAA